MATGKSSQGLGLAQLEASEARGRMLSVVNGTSMEEAKKAIDKLDVDKDGKVSYPEFILVMKYKK